MKFCKTITFGVYTGKELYPAFALSSIEIKYKGEAIDPDSFESDDETYQSLQNFSYIMTIGDVSMQVVTQNKSFAAHFLISDKDTQDLIFMSMIYGY